MKHLRLAVFFPFLIDLEPGARHLKLLNPAHSLHAGDSTTRIIHLADGAAIRPVMVICVYFKRP